MSSKSETSANKEIRSDGTDRITASDAFERAPGAKLTNSKLFSSLCVIVAILAASVEPIVVKLGYEQNLLPLHLLVVKTVVGALLILPLTRTFRWVGFKNLAHISLLAMLLLSTSALGIFALKQISAVLAITIITTTPAFVAICNQALGRDELTPKFWLGFFLCFSGVILGLEWHNLNMNLAGFILIFGAVVTSTTYRVTMEAAAKKYSPALISTYLFFVNGLLVSLFVLPFAGTIPDAAWKIGGWMGFASACANVAFLYALNLLGSTRISIINILQRPAIIVAAAFILKEPLTMFQGAGVLLVLVGVQLAQVKRKVKLPAQKSAG
ncbi:MAG: DMT family transporter [Candidatus Obscuribacterales bacterium]|nr:DMT family transporter [Candidatus Obscuribacterales bacterium]